MEGCIFCEIAEKRREAEMVAEAADWVIFKDANPKSRVHLLVVPRKHIAAISDAEEGDQALLGGLILAARDIAKRENLTGYKLLFNVGRDGGQVIDHVHLHLIAN